MKCKIIKCNNKIRNASPFCSKECCSRQYYLNNKKKKNRQSQEWAKRNPKKVKAYHKKAMDKYLKNHREQFNTVMRKHYRKHKGKWRFRCKCLLYKTQIYNFHNNKCNTCGSKEKLKITCEGDTWDKTEGYRCNLDLNIYKTKIFCPTCRSLYWKEKKLERT